MSSPQATPGGGRPALGGDSERQPAPPGGGQKVPSPRRRDLLFFVLLLGVFLEILRQAPSFTGVARITPVFLGAIGAIFAGIGAVRTLVLLLRGRSSARIAGTDGSAPLAARLSLTWDRPEVRAAGVAWLWLTGFATVIWLLGFVVGGALFGIAYLRASGSTWKGTLLTVGIPILLFSWVIPQFLIVDVYPGLLTSWLL